MAHLEGVAIGHSPSSCRVDERAALEPVVVGASDGFGGDRITGQHIHESVESFRLEAVGRRQLPEKGTGLPAESERAAREEIPQSPLAVPELEIVSNESSALDRENEVIVGNDFRPPREYRG